MTYDVFHTELAHEIHADNIKAGWWTDLKTGESIIQTRSRPEMLMLIVSELSEASEGFADDKPDDKLPQYYMFDVELADAAIRLYDLLGAECGGMNFDKAVRAAYDQWYTSPPGVNNSLMQLVNMVSGAMEGYRKGKRDVYLAALWRCLGTIYAVFEDYATEESLIEVIAAKRAFNSNRLDHKPENRIKDGGKAF